MPSTSERTLPQIEHWVTRQVAAYLDTAPEDIDPDVPIAQYGLDSVFALGLCGDIEETFDIEVSPTLAWDYPTIELIARFVAAHVSPQGSRERTS